MPSIKRESLLPLVGQFLEEHKGKRTVFIMMRFADHLLLNALLNVIREELNALGVEAVRGDDKYFAEEVWSNAQVYMLGADAGIAIFDNVTIRGRPPEGFNPNVPMEAGYMMGLDKAVLILKDIYLSDMPSNLRGVIYSKFNPDNPETARQKVREWAEGLFK